MPSVLHLQNLPPHTHVDLDFLLAIINTWDGVGGSGPGPDVFNVAVNGLLVFTHIFGTSTGGTDYSPPPGGLMAASGNDRAYNMYLEPAFQGIPDTSSTLEIRWFASGPGWQGGDDESWAIDHLQIVLYDVPPVVSGLFPAEGVAGDTISIGGAGFIEPIAVRFNGVEAAVLSATTTRIVSVVPDGAATGPVTVTTPAGTAASSAAFVVHRLPSVTSVSPAGGKPGISVAITGVNLGAVHHVRFGLGNNAQVEAVSDTEIHAIVSLDATTGPITLQPFFGRVVTGPKFTVVPLEPRPQIRAVYDVPKDQGGKVSVTWDRSEFDRPDLRSITGDRVWRRAGSPAAAAAGSTLEEGRDLRGALPKEGAARVPRQAAGEYWEPIATLPAVFLNGYALEAPTTQDSMSGSNPFSAFFVQGLTADPFAFYNSEPDSGYSVDNLAPIQPSPFAVVAIAGGTALHWGANREADLSGYRIYRGSDPNFVPGTGSFIASKPDTGYFDPGGPGGGYYKITAVDIHGNVSPYATASIDRPTTLMSLASIDVSAARVRLVWRAPAYPGVYWTLERRASGADWESREGLPRTRTGWLPSMMPMCVPANSTTTVCTG